MYIFSCLTTDEVNILQELSLQVSDASNASMRVEDSRCPVLQVGQYSTLALPLRQLFPDGYSYFSTPSVSYCCILICWFKCPASLSARGATYSCFELRYRCVWCVCVFVCRFADAFSLLVQLRSPQTEERSVFTMLGRDSHVALQLRISAHAVIFAATQQRHYE